MPERNAKKRVAGLGALVGVMAATACAPSIPPTVSPASSSLAPANRDSATALIACARAVALRLGYTRIDTALGRDQRYIGLALSPGEQPIIAERQIGYNTAALIAVVSANAAGGLVLTSTAREYDASHLPIAVERGSSVPIRFDDGGSMRATRPAAGALPPDLVGDLRELRASCGSPGSERGAD